MKKALVRSNFLDSGAFSIWRRANEYGRKTGDKWGYYNTDEFYEFLDAYAKFIQKYRVACDLYANIDAIGNPEITWRNQKILESQYGLRPVPVVHFNTNLSWLQKYIDEGYPLIGLGGMAKSVRGRQTNVRSWLDKVFDYVCENPERLPCVKLHGFGFTSYRLIVRYCWWSVDSTVWTQAAGYGNIYVPHLRHGEFDFKLKPYAIKVTETCKARAKRGQHMLTLGHAETNVIGKWLAFIDVPMGTSNAKKEPIIEGVSNSVNARRKANLLFFQNLAEAQPKYPWPFPARLKTTGLGFDMRKPS